MKGTIKKIEEVFLDQAISMDIFTLDQHTAKQWLPLRTIDSHKGTYGTVLVAAGSPGMMGAAMFASEAAYRSGCGLVKALVPASQSLAMTIRIPEAVQIIYENPEDFEIPDKISSVILGPGLGKQQKLFERIMSEIPETVPMIIDADGLNLLAASAFHRKNTIMTPHYGEASRLTGKTISELKKDPVATARSLAEKYESVVVLKNVPGIIISPDGRTAYNPKGNPGMSTAGSGDVLSGIIGGLMAQPSSLDLWQIAVLGTWLHGSAGDAAAMDRGLHALMASDLLAYLKPDQLVNHPEKQ